MSSIAISDPDPRAIATIRTLCIDAVGWERYVGERRRRRDGHVRRSAPLKELQVKFGFTPEAVVGIATARFAASAAG